MPHAQHVEAGIRQKNKLNCMDCTHRLKKCISSDARAQKHMPYVASMKTNLLLARKEKKGKEKKRLR